MSTSQAHELQEWSRRWQSTDRHDVTLVGAGVTGSHTVPILARQTEVTRINIIDNDTYDESNLACQNIRRSDVGRNKATVQAAHVRRLNPHQTVRAWTCPVQDVPRGHFAQSVMIGCVDSRAARQAINEIVWRLGIPWIDAGVDGLQRLARVNVYVPLKDAACMECAWSDVDYSALTQSYTCAGRQVRVASTAATASLGVVAAGLVGIALEQLSSGVLQNLGAGHQWMLDLANRRGHDTRYVRNPNCRFDHRQWTLDPIDVSLKETRLDGWFDRLEQESGTSAEGRGCSWQVVGRPFVRRLQCVHCHRASRDRLLLSGGLSRARLRCRHCGHQQAAVAFDNLEWLTRELTSRRAARRTLAGLGIRDQDIVAVRRGEQTRHVVVNAIDSLPPHGIAVASRQRSAGKGKTELNAPVRSTQDGESTK